MNGATSIREAFVKQFGEQDAAAIEAAAYEHANGINNQKIGSDPFKWALLIAIGYECMSKESYRKYHKITSSWDDLKIWIKEYGALGSHDGDVDYLCLVAGGYDDFVSK